MDDISIDELMKAALGDLDDTNEDPETADASTDSSSTDGSSTAGSSTAGSATSKTPVPGPASNGFDETVDKIFDLIDSGRTVEANKLAENLVDENISNSVAWYVLGLTQYEENCFDAAIKSLNQAIAIRNDFADAYLMLGKIYYKMDGDDNINTAAQYAKKALSYDDKLIDAKVIICDVLKETEGIDIAIEELKAQIDGSKEKEQLLNLLGTYYVEKAVEYMVEIPDRDFFDPLVKALKIQRGITDDDYDIYPGFISKYDIEDAKKYISMAQPLLTMDNDFVNDYKEMCSEILDRCETNNELYELSNNKFISVYQILLGIFHFLIAFCTWGIALPLMIGPVITKKANMVPGYVLNYMLYFDSASPLDFKEREFRKKLDSHVFIKNFISESKEDRKNQKMSEFLELLQGEGLMKYFGKCLFSMHTYLLKCRLAYYKRFFDMKKEQKKEREALAPAVDDVVTDEN